jgi:hypothetical protein
MARVERIREVVKGRVDQDQWKQWQQKSDAGWQLVAVEWRREIEGEEPEHPAMMEDVPYGLRVAGDCLRLEEDPAERNVLVHMMELIVQDHSVSAVAAELNSAGMRTRKGRPWSPVDVFNMLPRLIEVGPRIFSADDWEERRERLLRAV